MKIRYHILEAFMTLTITGSVLQVHYIHLLRKGNSWRHSKYPFKGVFCGSEVYLNHPVRNFSLFWFFSLFAKYIQHVVFNIRPINTNYYTGPTFSEKYNYLENTLSFAASQKTRENSPVYVFEHWNPYKYIDNHIIT